MEQKPIDLRGFRLANNITQGELADYLGVTRGFISSIENGRANLPDKKLEYLYTMSKKEKSWDTDKLMPYFTRIKKLIEYLNSNRSQDSLSKGIELNKNEFPEGTLGISLETYNRIRNGKSAITPTITEQLTKKIPDLSAEWLMTGEGDVFLKESPSSINNDEIRQELKAIRKEVTEMSKALELLYRIILEPSPSKESKQ